jgi:hypothetical protein
MDHLMGDSTQRFMVVADQDRRYLEFGDRCLHEVDDLGPMRFLNGREWFVK